MTSLFKNEYDMNKLINNNAWRKDILSNSNAISAFIIEASNDRNDENSWVAITDGETNQSGSGNTTVIEMQIYGK